MIAIFREMARFTNSQDLFNMYYVESDIQYNIHIIQNKFWCSGVFPNAFYETDHALRLRPNGDPNQAIIDFFKFWVLCQI